MIRGLPRPAKKGELVAIDLEMYGQDVARLHRPHGTFACLSISYGPKETYQIYDIPDLRKTLKLVAKGEWVGHNFLYDLRQLRALVDIPQRQVWDCMLVEQGLYGGWFGSFALEDLHRRYLAKPMNKGIVSEFGRRTTMTVPMQNYAARDAEVTLEIAKLQQRDIEANGISMRHYFEIDEKMLWCILDMPRVRIDVDGWLKLAAYHKSRGVQLEKQLGFNTFSSEVAKAAIEKMVGFRIKDTNGKETLEPLVKTLRRSNREREALFVEDILLARQFRKAAETYGQSWVDQHVEPGGFVYPDWNNNGTKTARTACSKPSLQNTPVRDIPAFRSLFISRHGKAGRMLIADMEQQEPRITAALSGDPDMKADIMAGKDLYKQAVQDFGLDSRDAGKTVELGLGYGMSAWTLARRVGISEDQARAGIRRRNSRYPAVVEWGHKQIAMASSLDYVKSTMGRRIWVNRYERYGGADRGAINYSIQATAAEQTKLWQNLLHKWCRDEGYDYSICLAVHDEVVADAPLETAAAWRKEMKSMGIESGRVTVPGFPVKVKVSTGVSWGDKKK